jgi:hypothetical protein
MRLYVAAAVLAQQVSLQGLESSATGWGLHGYAALLFLAPSPAIIH